MRELKYLYKKILLRSKKIFFKLISLRKMKIFKFVNLFHKIEVNVVFHQLIATPLGMTRWPVADSSNSVLGSLSNPRGLT